MVDAAATEKPGSATGLVHLARAIDFTSSLEKGNWFQLPVADLEYPLGVLGANPVSINLQNNY